MIFERERGLLADLNPAGISGEITRVVGLVAEIGGLEYARERAQRLAVQAEAELDALPAGPARDALRASITYVLDRRR